MIWFICLLLSLVLSATGREDHQQLSPADKFTYSYNSELFTQESLLPIRIRGDIKSLLKDRSEEVSYHEMELMYETDQGELLTHPLKIRSRGNFRRKKENCFYAPLLLNFVRKKIPENSLFQGQNKLKLVTPCQSYKYVLKEYLAYKLYRVVSDASFRVRMVMVHLEDQQGKQIKKPFYGFLIEDEDELAQRHASKILKKNRIAPQNIPVLPYVKMAMFQYLIGNTDWSVQFRHNVKILIPESEIDIPTNVIAVPYDFDHAGIVNASYAKPAQQLKLASVRIRRFRSYCLSDQEEELEKTIEFYLALKPDIFKTLTEDQFLADKDKKQISAYIEDFYRVLNNEKKRKLEFNYPCLPNGTGNIVIKGLNK